jgi:hypothetical protein
MTDGTREVVTRVQAALDGNAIDEPTRSLLCAVRGVLRGPPLLAETERDLYRRCLARLFHAIPEGMTLDLDASTAVIAEEAAAWDNGDVSDAYGLPTNLHTAQKGGADHG